MNKAELTKEFGRRVRQCRKSQKLTQSELADKVGCHYTYIGHIERGEKTVTISSAVRIARALGVSLVSLVEGLDN